MHVGDGNGVDAGWIDSFALCCPIWPQPCGGVLGVKGADVEAADKVGVSCGLGCVDDDDDDDDTVLVVLLFVHLTCCGGPGQGVV